MKELRQDSTFRGLLKSSTSALHQSLEQTPLMSVMSNGSPSLDDYYEYLRRQFSIIAPLETQLRSWLSPENSALRLVKTDWLLTDLKAFGYDNIRHSTEVPVISSMGAAIGVQYVLEGSTMGLQLLRLRLQNEHPLLLSKASCFLIGYGENARQYWKNFVEYLGAQPDAYHEPAIEAAHSTFSAYYRVFSELK
jgi:heme oxygenase (biliverdin-IX-beta and delta-forming)